MQIITHKRPDTDEILAICMFVVAGRKMFPGAEKAKLSFANPEDPSLDGDTAEKRETIMIGIGHGRFDEHARPGAGVGQKKGKCAATLVAEVLGLVNNPEWKKLLTCITANDVQGRGNQFDFNTIPKQMFNHLPHHQVVDWMVKAMMAIHFEEANNACLGTTWTPDASEFNEFFEEWLVGKDRSDPALQPLLKFVKTRLTAKDMFGIRGIPGILRRYMDAKGQDGKAEAKKWTLLGIEEKYQDQWKFLNITAPEFAEKAKIREIKVKGETLKVAVVESDNTQMSRFARSELGGYCAIVVQRQGTGNTQIHSNKHYGLNIGPLVPRLRQAELDIEGVELADPSQLPLPGKVARWYYFEEGQALLNGSLKADVEPTYLSLDRIVDVVCSSLSD